MRFLNVFAILCLIGCAATEDPATKTSDEVIVEAQAQIVDLEDRVTELEQAVSTFADFDCTEPDEFGISTATFEVPATAILTVEECYDDQCYGPISHRRYNDVVEVTCSAGEAVRAYWVSQKL